VNAAEDPQSAGYLAAEMEILTWLGKPVVVALNQLGPEGAGSLGAEAPRDHAPPAGEGTSGASPLRAWRRHLERFPVVRDVLPLDAFARAWMEESALLHRIAEVLDGSARETMAALARAWHERNAGVFATAVDAMASYLAGVAADREPIRRDVAGARRGLLDARILPRVVQDLRDLAGVDRTRATGALFDRAQAATGRLMDRLISLHELSGVSRARIERRLDDVTAPELGLGPTTGALAGSVLTGALGGVGADLLSGGLSFGGGAVVGGILGFIGGYTLGGAYRLLAGHEPAVGWQTAALDRLARETLLRYLAVSHFGRGRGAYSDVEHPAYWNDAVRSALDARRHALHEAWGDAARDDGRIEAEASLRTLVGSALSEVLSRNDPGPRVPRRG
jgi:hypothetical protein